MKIKNPFLFYSIFVSVVLNFILFGIIEIYQSIEEQKSQVFEVSYIKTTQQKAPVRKRLKVSKRATKRVRKKNPRSTQKIVKRSLPVQTGKKTNSEDYLKRVSTVSIAELNRRTSYESKLHHSKPSLSINNKPLLTDKIHKASLYTESKQDGQEKQVEKVTLSKVQSDQISLKVRTSENHNDSIDSGSAAYYNDREGIIVKNEKIIPKGEKSLNDSDADQSNTSSKAFQIIGEISKRKVLFRPQTPEANSEMNKRVTLLFDVNPLGKVEQAMPITKKDSHLEQAAIDYLNRFRFEPVSSSIGIQKGKITIYFQRNNKV